MSVTELRRKIAENLRQVIDPELGVNVVDLGLVYDILIEGDNVIVKYTATTPGCPMRRFLQQQVEEALEKIKEVKTYEAQLIWEPPWSIEMIIKDVDFFAHPPPQLQ